MQAQLVDLYRAGIRSATDMMKLSLEQTERLQQQQLQLIRNALDETTRSTTQTGELKKSPPTRSCHLTSPVAALMRLKIPASLHM